MMIIRNTTTWQRELTDAVTDLDELRRLLELPKDIGQSVNGYPLLVPHSFVDRMEKGNPNDPLLLQVLPQVVETKSVVGFSPDPLDEFPVGSASLQKYAGRRLLLPTDRCGIHCRFCFRRHTRRTLKLFEQKDFETMIDPVRRDATVEEVILSGGDPLTLVDRELKRLLHYIAKIPHVKRIRIHSRLPMVLPSRLTPELAETLSLPQTVYFVLHVNHPNEIPEDFLHGFSRPANVVFLSQSVLLKKVNDDFKTLHRLFERLADLGILPYYLHQLDRVSGAAHFEVEPEVGRKLISQLRETLPGYAVPRYVQEIPGAPCKLGMENGDF